MPCSLSSKIASLKEIPLSKVIIPPVCRMNNAGVKKLKQSSD